VCSIAYGAALGDSDIVGNAMSIFKGGMASEILNGRSLSAVSPCHPQMWQVFDVCRECSLV
jgi:hypothetical protein